MECTNTREEDVQVRAKVCWCRSCVHGNIVWVCASTGKQQNIDGQGRS